MSKKGTYFIIFIIFILAFFAANFVYPTIFQKKRVYPKFLPERDFKLGLDLQGGSHLVYQADLSQIEEKEKTVSMEGLRDIIEKRIRNKTFGLGVEEPLVQIQGERLIVELAGVVDPAEAIKQIGQTPFLEFKEQLSTEERDKNFQAILGDGAKEISSDKACMDFNFLIRFIQTFDQDPCYKPTQLTGRYLKKAEPGFDQMTYQPLVLLQFDDEGSKIFEELTEKNVGKILAIYIDQMPISLPVVQEKISGGKAQITGKFTIEEAKKLAQNLHAGALPIPIELISQQSVGPSLGKISLEKSLKAGIFGFLAIIIFMILFYRLPGFFASLALLIYVIFVLSLFKLIPVTLTLAGIGGFLLSIGMAVDANILIFSRMREELRIGKNFTQSLEEGFSRAWPAIRDGNLTTLIVALILFIFGSGFVKGFATTLIIGILISIFTAIIITKNFLKLFSNTRFEKILWLWK